MRDKYLAKRIAKRIVAEATLALPPGTNKLPDNDQWTNRFEIRSESSDRVYIVAQHKGKGHWGCSCPGWRTRRKCKHLTALGLPALEEPHMVTIASRLLRQGRAVVTLENCSKCGHETEHADDGVTSECVKCGETIPSPD